MIKYDYPFLILSNDPNFIEKQRQLISSFGGAVIGINVSDHNTGHLLHSNIAPSSVGVWGHNYPREDPQEKLPAAMWVYNNLKTIEEFLGVGNYLLVLGDESKDSQAAACLIRMLVACGRNSDHCYDSFEPKLTQRLNRWLNEPYYLPYEKYKELDISVRINDLEKWLDGKVKVYEE